MARPLLSRFESIVRRVHLFSDEEIKLEAVTHPFDERNISPKLPPLVKNLFDDGYYAQATFEAFKFVDKLVSKLSKCHKSGVKLMMDAFSKDSPLIQLTPMSSDSEKDEQEGYRFIFAGTVMAIRNPRGHEYSITDDIEGCLDHLGLASLLIRRIEQAGFKI